MSAVAERIEDEPVEVEQQVTPLELFFDLVFVFAITQVTGFVSADATWTRLIEGLAILAALWFAWESYVWLANSAASDEGAVRVVLLFAMGALLIVSLAVPRAFGDDGLVFGVAYFVVRAAHICAYLIVARGDEQLRGVVVRLARTVVPGAALLVVAGALDGTAQALCWAGALAIDYGGLAGAGASRAGAWQPRHFAERHGLIVIIALGESIVALGVGAGELGARRRRDRRRAAGHRDRQRDVVGVLRPRRPGRASAACAAAPRRAGAHRARFLHLPAPADGRRHRGVRARASRRPWRTSIASSPPCPPVALCGGAALYFLALSAFKRRNIGSFNYPRAGRRVSAGRAGADRDDDPGAARRGAGGSDQRGAGRIRVRGVRRGARPHPARQRLGAAEQDATEVRGPQRRTRLPAGAVRNDSTMAAVCSNGSAMAAPVSTDSAATSWPSRLGDQQLAAGDAAGVQRGEALQDGFVGDRRVPDGEGGGGGHASMVLVQQG